jgi:hypothetical protein
MRMTIRKARSAHQQFRTMGWKTGSKTTAPRPPAHGTLAPVENLVIAFGPLRTTFGQIGIGFWRFGRMLGVHGLTVAQGQAARRIDLASFS